VSDTWTFSHNQWSSTGASGPSARYAAAMAWDEFDREAVLFGGYSGTGLYFNDTWTYSHGSWSNATGTTNHTPSARWRASMTYDASDGYIVLFGGTNSLGTALSDTWKFFNGTWTQLTVNGTPPVRFRASMTYDPVDNTTVLFGGCTSTSCASPDSVTWGYHNYNWTNLNPSSHPSARVYYGVTYSPVARTVLLWGGSTSSASNVPVSDTWNFTNNTWTSLTSSITRAPTATAYVGMVYDAADGFTVMFGGQWANGTFSNRTWALGPSILGQLSIAPGGIDLGQSAVVNATPIAFSSYVNYTYTALPPGCAAGNISTFTCTPTATGTFPVNVTLNDSVGKPTAQSGTISVSADPAINSSAWTLATVTVGTSTTLRTVAAGGTGTLRYGYTNLPTGCGSVNNPNLTCIPTQSGTFSVHVTVTDGANFAIVKNVTLLVNAKPTFGALVTVPSSIDQGQSFTVYANVTAGTAPITYSYRGLPTPCLSANASSVVCTPAMTGSTVITVNVTDTFGWSNQSTVGVSVAADPTFSSGVATPAAFDVGTPVTIWANASGGTGLLAYSYSGAPTGCVLTNRPSNTCTPTASGNFTVTANVTDAAGFLVHEAIVVVVNPTMIVGPIVATPTAIDVGQNVTILAAPTGGTAPFSYAFAGLPRGCPQSPSSSSVSCAPRVSGVYTLTVAVTDASGITSPSGGSLTVNDDPTIVSFVASDNPVTVNTAFHLTVVAQAGSHVYSYAYSGLPTGCASANTSALACTPTATGSYSVKVTVKDSFGVSAANLTNVTVAAVASSTFLGLSGSLGYALIGLIILIVLVVVVAAVLLMRRRPPGTKAPPAEPKPERWSEENPDS
jgi:galactose oxidase-like protein